jgi:hypothetical protein
MNPLRNPPPLRIAQWFNTPQPITLESLHGRVVMLHAFQMLCPGCVSHGIPQAVRVRHTFDEGSVVVLGLHTVFEHHAAMTPLALEAFLHEYRLPFAVGVDQPDDSGGMPQTMRAYGLRGTPSVMLFDRTGALRLNHFGPMDDMALGALIGQLLAQAEGMP